MDQRELVHQLEGHFRKEDALLQERLRASRQEQDALSDEEWWDQLVARTKEIRPQMMEVFERNKEEMIRNRPKRIGSEEAFREKTIQRHVIEILPFVAAYRDETNSSGDLTDDQIYVATMRRHAETTKVNIDLMEKGKDKVKKPRKHEMLDLIVDDAKTHQAEMAEFLDPANLTDEKWDAHSKRLEDRMSNFQLRMEEIFQQKPEGTN